MDYYEALYICGPHHNDVWILESTYFFRLAVNLWDSKFATF